MKCNLLLIFLFLLSFCAFIYGGKKSDSRGLQLYNEHRVDINDILETPTNMDSDQEENDLATLILCFQLKAIRNGIGVHIRNIMCNKLRRMRSSEEFSSNAHIRELEGLMFNLNSERQMQKVQKKILKDAQLYSYINDMVSEAIEEYSIEKDKEIEVHKNIAQKKEKQRRVAIGATLLSALIGASTTLIVSLVGCN